MEVSIIISTFNRSSNLNDCLQHLEDQKNTEHFAWEALVVDNNSTDDTKKVTETLKKKLSINIRYVFESNQGLSYARNCGIDESAAEYVIFIDDDIRVTPSWLAAIHHRFVAEDCDAVGGIIHVESPEFLPAWITENMYGFLGHRDFGEHAFKMNGIDQFPFGGNMAVRRSVAASLNGFDTRMGRKGEGKKREELFKGEETDFFHRLAKTDCTLWYEPDAIVLHKILPYQLRKNFFRTLHYNAGYQKSMLDASTLQRHFQGVPLFIFTQTMVAALKYLRQIFSLGLDNAFRQQMNISYFIGMIYGYRQKYISLKISK